MNCKNCGAEIIEGAAFCGNCGMKIEAEQEQPVFEEPAQQEAKQEEQPTMAELMQSIAKLTSAVQANAIAQSVIPQGLQNPPSAEDMLAEIIRPTYKERG